MKFKLTLTLSVRVSVKMSTLHATIIPEGTDVDTLYSLDPCKGCLFGCKGLAKNYHCPLCPGSKFHPSTKPKVQAHVRSHFTGSRGCVTARGKSLSLFSFLFKVWL